VQELLPVRLAVVVIILPPGLAGAGHALRVELVANLLLRHRQHVLIPPKAIGLPHDEGTRTDFRDLRQHLLEPRTVLRGAGYGRVLVLPHDSQTVLVRPLVVKLLLLVDARIVLRVGREAVVRDSEVDVVLDELLAFRQTSSPPNVAYLINYTFHHFRLKPAAHEERRAFLRFIIIGRHTAAT